MTTVPSSGSYGCVDISSVFGFAIRHFTHSEYDHAFVVLDAVAGTILEAQPSGAKLSNLSKYSHLPMVFSQDQVLGGDPVGLSKLAQQFIGIPYGFLDIAYLGLELEGIKWRWLLDRVLTQDRMICSQLVATFGVYCGARSWKCGQQYAQLVTPGMLAARASNASLR